MVKERTIACPTCGGAVPTNIPYRKSMLCGRCNLFSELQALFLESATEPQRNLHFPLNRTARTRDGRGGWNRKPQGAVVVKTYDMRGRIGLIEDATTRARGAFQAGDREALRAYLAEACDIARGAIEVLGIDMPISDSKGEKGR